MEKLLCKMVFLLAFICLMPVAMCDSENKDYVVEVLAVIDKSMYDTWISTSGVGTKEKVLAEVKSLFYEVNEIYKSLQRYNLSVEIRLKDVVFPSSPIVPDSAVMADKTVWERQVSSFFNGWLKANPQYTYDHAMIITDHAMKGSGRVDGVALTAAACRKDGTSRVRGRRDYGTVLVAAHEIGHSLGAHHDGKTKRPCLDGYLMSPWPWHDSRNKFSFSSCSAGDIRWYITQKLKKDNNRCLLETTSSPIVSKRIGELFDHRDTCKRRGKWVSPSTQKGDVYCKVLKCQDHKWMDTTSAPEGTLCGSGKRCFKGYCQ